MAQLHGLIKFKRHELDEKRQILARLNEELEALKQRKENLLDDLAREKNLAAVDIDIARNFGPFLTRTLERIEAFDHDIAAKQREIQAATHVVQEAFLEVKKLEVTQQNRDDEETRRLGRIETNTLNDIGLETFRRGQDGKN